ncbi:MAG: hypothetical protein ACT4NV_02645 [Rhodoferax sp.]
MAAAQTGDTDHRVGGGFSAPSAQEVTNLAMLGRLLALGQRYRQEGNLRQATELFWTLVEEHPQTPQAEAAKLALLELAEGYGRAGAQRMERSMYERLLDIEG